MSIVFDPLVFDVAVFDASFAVPSMFKVSVENEFRIVKSGQSVSVVAHICSSTISVGQKYLINTDGTPQVQIYNPDGTINVAYVNMTNVAVGKYMYVWTPSGAGMYSAQFKVINGPYTLLTPKMFLFEVL